MMKDDRMRDIRDTIILVGYHIRKSNCDYSFIVKIVCSRPSLSKSKIKLNGIITLWTMTQACELLFAATTRTDQIALKLTFRFRAHVTACEIMKTIGSYVRLCLRESARP